MTRLQKVKELTNVMVNLKNYSVKLMLFLIMDSDIPKRYTVKSLMGMTGLPSGIVQKAIKELEENDLLFRKYVGEGKSLKYAPEFIIFPNNFQDKVECST